MLEVVMEVRATLFSLVATAATQVLGAAAGTDASTAATAYELVAAMATCAAVADRLIGHSCMHRTASGLLLSTNACRTHPIAS